MITFKVVKETHGWAVRLGDQMTTPFWSKASAVQEASRLAETLGCHGEYTEVLVDGVRSAHALSPGARGDLDAA